MLIALEGERGRGLRRSIPGFDLLGGPGSRGGAPAALRRPPRRRGPGARGAPGRGVPRGVLRPRGRAPAPPPTSCRRCASTPSRPATRSSLELAEELRAAHALRARATLASPCSSPPPGWPIRAPMGEGRHVALLPAAGGARSRCVRFGAGSALPVTPGEPVDAAVRARNRPLEWHGRSPPDPPLRAPRARPGDRDHRRARELFAGAGCARSRPRPPRRPRLPPGGASPGGVRRATCGSRASRGLPRRPRRDRRARPGGDRPRAPSRARPRRAGPRLRGDLSGPPSRTTRAGATRSPTSSRWTRRAPSAARPSVRGGWTHLAWGTPDPGFAVRIHEWNFALRDPLVTVFRALRAAGVACGEACEAVLRGDGRQPRSAALAGRLVRVLAELGLVGFDRGGPALTPGRQPERTPLEHSAAYRGTSDGSRTDGDT